MKQPGPLRTGIVGFGKMGRIRKAVLDGRDDCVVTWLCDSLPMAVDCEFTTDPFKLVREPSLDAVFVCTPNYLTRDLVVEALDHGKHVFAEKPPGTSVGDVCDMVEAERRNPGLKLKFGFNHRYHGSMIEAKRRIESGEYGEILWMRGRYGKSVDRGFLNDWRSQKRYACGGILMDQGIHMLDLFLLFGEDFEEVKSFCSNLYWNLDVEDNVFALLRNNRGQVASLHSTMTQWRHLFALEIFLERGYMVINGILSSSGKYGKEELTIALNRAAAPEARHTREEKYTYEIDESWNDEVEEFVSAIRSDGPIRIGTTADAQRLMRIVEKIYEDGFTKTGGDDSRPDGQQAGAEEEYAAAAGTSADFLCD
jgi:predicted dehydrogenase